MIDNEQKCHDKEMEIKVHNSDWEPTTSRCIFMTFNKPEGKDSW